MMIPEWKELGIPEAYGPYRLLYNPPSGTVVVELRSIGEEFFPNQVYIRQKDSTRYEPIKAHEPLLSSESVVTSLGRPLLFYVSNRLIKREQHYGGEWEGLYSFDIRTRTSVKLASRDSLWLPPPYIKGWINGIVDVSADASEIYLRVGAARSETSEGFPVVDNQLARMDLPTRKIHFITPLRGAFF